MTSHVSDPLPATAALAVLDVVEHDDLPARARERGRHLHGRLTDGRTGTSGSVPPLQPSPDAHTPPDAPESAP
jgi:adenosylmethionine-8-amino-7-oxononanoate aminotransferase